MSCERSRLLLCAISEVRLACLRIARILFSGDCPHSQKLSWRISLLPAFHSSGLRKGKLQVSQSQKHPSRVFHLRVLHSSTPWSGKR